MPDARARAGLSQAELARRAGVAQSVISVYESGRRQPSLPTLAILVEATGSAIDISLATEPAPSPNPLPERVRALALEIKGAAAAHGVRIIGVFGSVARGDARRDTDVDLASWRRYAPSTVFGPSITPDTPGAERSSYEQVPLRVEIYAELVRPCAPRRTCGTPSTVPASLER